jgi:hypothetical protein
MNVFKLSLSLALPALASLAAACGSTTSTTSTTSSSSSGSSGAPAWADFCAKQDARDKMCDPNNPPSPTLMECQGAETCFDAAIRPEIKADFLNCIETRDCMTSVDACLTKAAMAHPPSQAATDFSTACLAKSAGCMPMFHDDYCDPSAINETVVKTFQDCLAKPCEQIEACLSAAGDAVRAPCGGTFGI